jgi:hypothetical protein
MTLKDGLYYCDICKHTNPIPKGQGFSFHNNPLGIDHAHQSCYLEAKSNAGTTLGRDKKQIAKDLYKDSKLVQDYNRRREQ